MKVLSVIAPYVAGLVFLAYLLGAFDVFLASNHLPLPLHDCVEYGNVLHTEWYCNGPWSTHPYTDEIKAQLGPR